MFYEQFFAKVCGILHNVVPVVNKICICLFKKYYNVVVSVLVDVCFYCFFGVFCHCSRLVLTLDKLNFASAIKIYEFILYCSRLVLTLPRFVPHRFSSGTAD